MTQEHLVDDPELHAAAAGLVSLLGPQARSSLEHHIDLTNARGVQIGDNNTQTNNFS